MYFKLKQVLLNMRNPSKLYIGAVLVVAMTLSSCQPDEEPFKEETTPPPAAYTFTAKLGGTNWSGTQNLSLLVKNSTGSPSKEMRISANSTDGKLVTLSLADASTGVSGDGIAVKTYLLQANGSGDASFLHVNTNTNKTYIGAYGSVNITQSDAANKKLSGTFSCTLFQAPGDSLKITNGVLTDVPYEITEQ
jgi:hypothetical protein